MSTLWLKIGIPLFLVAVIGAGVFSLVQYHKGLNEEIAELKVDNTTLMAELVEARVNLYRFENHTKALKEATTELLESSQEAQRERAEMLRLFRDHNLQELAIEKRQMLEDRINAGTKEVFDAFESISSN